MNKPANNKFRQIIILMAALCAFGTVGVARAGDSVHPEFSAIAADIKAQGRQALHQARRELGVPCDWRSLATRNLGQALNDYHMQDTQLAAAGQ